MSRRRLVVGVVALLVVLGGLDAWAYLSEERALRSYLDVEAEAFGGTVEESSIADADRRMQANREAAVEDSEVLDKVKAIVIAPLPWHRRHRLAKEALVRSQTLLVEIREIQIETWRLVREGLQTGRGAL